MAGDGSTSGNKNVFLSARFLSASSSMQGCEASNLLSGDDGSIWLSDGACPQTVEVELSAERRRTIRSFGWLCWERYASNPAVVELHVHKGAGGFARVGTFSADQTKKVQLFDLAESIDTYRFRTLRIVVKQVSSGDEWTQCYMNTLMAFEETADQVRAANPGLAEMYAEDSDAEHFSEDDLNAEDISADSVDGVLRSIIDESRRESLGDRKKIESNAHLLSVSPLEFETDAAAAAAVPPSRARRTASFSFRESDEKFALALKKDDDNEFDLGRKLAEMDWCVKRVAHNHGVDPSVGSSRASSSSLGVSAYNPGSFVDLLEEGNDVAVEPSRESSRRKLIHEVMDHLVQRKLGPEADDVVPEGLSPIKKHQDSFILTEAALNESRATLDKDLKALITKLRAKVKLRAQKKEQLDMALASVRSKRRSPTALRQEERRNRPSTRWFRPAEIVDSPSRVTFSHQLYPEPVVLGSSLMNASEAEVGATPRRLSSSPHRGSRNTPSGRNTCSFYLSEAMKLC